MLKIFGSASLVMLALLSLAGCGQKISSSDPRWAKWRSTHLLSAEPEGAESVLDVRETLQENKSDAASHDVVLVGRIGGVANPWGRDEASFVVVEPSLVDEPADHGHQHDAASCPFCSKKADPLSTLALVKVVDAAGHALPVDVRELFALKLNQTVVVRGRAALDASGQLLLSARGVYIRQ